MKATSLPIVFVILTVGCGRVGIAWQLQSPEEATAQAGPTEAPPPTQAPPPSPNAFLIAFPDSDAVEGWEWPEGGVVRLRIDDPATGTAADFEAEGISAATSWGDPRTIARFDLSTQYDLKAGDIVVVTDGTTARTHVVRGLAVTAIDATSDTVSGATLKGAQVDAWPHEHDGTATVRATVGEDGAWLASFAGVFDLATGTGGHARVLDAAGNSTAVDWTAPPPSPTATPTPTLPPTETPVATATRTPAPQPTAAPIVADPFTGTWVVTMAASPRLPWFSRGVR